MNNKKKGLLIFGLSVICVALAVGVFMLGRPPKGEDELYDMGDIYADVTVTDISEDVAETPDINPSDIESDELLNDEDGDDIMLTVIPEEPAPPELPDTAHRDDENPDPEEIPTDIALTNPDKKPDVTPPPVEPDKPKSDEPKSGDTNDNGEIYIPGFGWVKNEGGGTIVEPGQLDPDHADFDKIIGY